MFLKGLEAFCQKEEKRTSKKKDKLAKKGKALEVDEEEEVRAAMEAAQLAHLEDKKKRRRESKDAETPDKVSMLTKYIEKEEKDRVNKSFLSSKYQKRARPPKDGRPSSSGRITPTDESKERNKGISKKGKNANKTQGESTKVRSW